VFQVEVLIPLSIQEDELSLIYQLIINLIDFYKILIIIIKKYENILIINIYINIINIKIIYNKNY
jgi:hypothetical protein